MGELLCDSQPPAPTCVVWCWRLKGSFAPASAVMGRLHLAFSPIYAQRLYHVMRTNKAETAVHGCHCPGGMALRNRRLVFECVTCFFLFFLLYLCLLFGCRWCFLPRKKRILWCDCNTVSANRVSHHNYKPTIRCVAIVQSGSFFGYNVSRCSPYTSYKNWSGFSTGRCKKCLRKFY